MTNYKMSINIEKRFFHPSNIKPLLDEICHQLRITNNEGRANTKNTLESIMEEIYDSNQELIESKPTASMLDKVNRKVLK